MCYAALPTIKHEDWLKDTQHLLAGQRLVIETKISGIPKPSISWTYNEQPVLQSNHVSVETKNGTSTLTLSEVTLAESGSFKVKATNEVGSAEAEFKVDVKGMIQMKWYLKYELLMWIDFMISKFEWH